MILAIDPGSTESGVVLINKDFSLKYFDIIPNDKAVSIIESEIGNNKPNVAIEMVAHYGSGMPAGKTVFDTCVWIGRFTEAFVQMGLTVTTIPRQTVKLHLCHSARAKDQNVIQALVDRFASDTHGKYGKGTKKDPGFFYGFRDDVWQAFALGVTYIDLKEEGNL